MFQIIISEMIVKLQLALQQDFCLFIHVYRQLKSVSVCSECDCLLVRQILRPTEQFLAPKLIIIIKCLIDISLMFLYVEQDVNLA